MGKGSLLTLSIHAFVCGKQALAVRASGLASFLTRQRLPNPILTRKRKDAAPARDPTFAN
jgi:hypothetical protein